jgi:hypothetical protein
MPGTPALERFVAERSGGTAPSSTSQSQDVPRETSGRADSTAAADRVCLNLEELNFHGDIPSTFDLGTVTVRRGEFDACCQHCWELTNANRGTECTGFVWADHGHLGDGTSYCYLKGFTANRPRGQFFALPRGENRSNDNRRAYIMPETADLIQWHTLQNLLVNKLNRPVCREFGAPYASDPNTMDLAEAAWESARRDGATDDDVEQRKAHVRAVMSAHAFAPFGSSRDWSEAEAWNRFDFTNCCGNVASFHMVMTVKGNAGSMKQDCTGTDWPVCARHGAYDYDQEPRWTGANGYDRFMTLAFKSRTEAMTLPRDSPKRVAAEAGQAGRTSLYSLGDPILDHASVLPLFPHFPISLSGDILTEAQLHDARLAADAGAVAETQKPESACVRLLQTTPLSNFEPAAVRSFGSPDAAVTAWARQLPGWTKRNGSGYIVNNCFVCVRAPDVSHSPVIGRASRARAPCTALARGVELNSPHRPPPLLALPPPPYTVPIPSQHVRRWFDAPQRFVVGRGLLPRFKLGLRHDRALRV